MEQSDFPSLLSLSTWKGFEPGELWGASTPAPEATVVAEVAPAVADTGEIRVQLDALEHKLLSALHERIDAVKAEFETHKADIVGAGAASRLRRPDDRVSLQVGGLA